MGSNAAGAKENLSNVGIERAVLSCLYNCGAECFYDTQDILNAASFTNEINGSIYKCISNIFEHDEHAVMDIPSILTSSRELGLDHLFTTKEDREHLRSVINTPAKKENVRKFAAQLRKLQITRLIYDQLQVRQNDLLDLTGNESINEILAKTEIDFSSLINDGGTDGLKKLGDSLKEKLIDRLENPVEQIGISTGFPIYDQAIGGGLRGGSVNVLVARMKAGKSVFCANIGRHVAKNLQIPVLYLDTELRLTEQQDRMLACVSGVEINDIETGKFGKRQRDKQKVMEAADEIDGWPYHHVSVAGMGVEDQLAFMRRWIRQFVGLRNDGKAKPCLIIVDYLKLMTDDTLKNMQEYQALGFIMTSLHNFSMRYDIPIFVPVQANRDGITKESSDIVGGSDRILQLCTNCSIFKQKSDEEIQEDGPEEGNRKLVVIMARHGPAMEDRNYINMQMDGKFARIREMKTKFEINNEKKTGKRDGGSFETNFGEDEDIPFT